MCRHASARYAPFPCGPRSPTRRGDGGARGQPALRAPGRGGRRGPARRACRRRYPGSQRQDALLQSAGPPSPPGRSGRTRALSLPDEGAGAGSVGGVARVAGAIGSRGARGAGEHYQDGILSLSPLSPPLPALFTAATYDGDTPSAQRTKIRDGARGRALEPRHAPRRHLATAPALGCVLLESGCCGDRRDARLSWRLRVARRQRPAPPTPHLPLLRQRTAVLPGVCDHRQSRCGRRAHGGGAGDGDRPGTRRRAAGCEGNRVLQPAPARSGTGHSTQQHSGGQRPGCAFPGSRCTDYRLRKDAARHGVGADRTASHG